MLLQKQEVNVKKELNRLCVVFNDQSKAIKTARSIARALWSENYTENRENFNLRYEQNILDDNLVRSYNLHQRNLFTVSGYPILHQVIFEAVFNGLNDFEFFSKNNTNFEKYYWKFFDGLKTRLIERLPEFDIDIKDIQACFIQAPMIQEQMMAALREELEWTQINNVAQSSDRVFLVDPIIFNHFRQNGNGNHNPEVDKTVVLRPSNSNIA